MSRGKSVTSGGAIVSLKHRSLLTIDDFSNGEIEALFSLADEMSGSMNELSGVCQGKIMASLFFEPSTRTRLSFEAAMHRLGGGVISAVDIGATHGAGGGQLCRYHRHQAPMGGGGQGGG
jgi:aspartate carbamoyltransferase catalytic subunit